VQLPLKELGAAQKKEVGENQGREVVLMHDAGRFIPTPRILEVGCSCIRQNVKGEDLEIWKGNCQKTCVQ
jgi:hypothetical protein